MAVAFNVPPAFTMVDLSEENRLGLLISIPVYFAALACCAVWAHFKEERLAQGGTGSVADKLSAHYLGGRTFGPLITGGTVFASLFSGYAVVGIPNESFRYGWTALRWIPQGAAFSAGVAGAGVRLRKASLVRNHQTAVDFMTDRYQSQLLRYTIVLLQIVPSVIFLAAQVIALQQTINSIFGLDPDTSYTVISIMFLILLFEWGGGLSSVAITDVIQGFVMIISFTCLAVVVKTQFGGWVDLDPNVYPRKDFYQTPGAEDQVEILQFSVINISIFTLPTMMQRNYAARDLKSLKVGWSSLILGSWAIMFVSIFLGTVGVQMLAGEPTPVSPFSAIVEEVMSLGGFPRVVGTLVFTAAIAAIMSTADSLTIAISQLITAEIFYPLRPQASPRKVAWFGRFVSLLTIIVGLLIGIFWKDGITALASIQFPMSLQAFFPFVVGLFANDKYDYHPWCLSAGAISGLLFVVIFFFTYLYLNEDSRPIDPGIGGFLLNVFVASFLEFVIRRKVLIARRTNSDDTNDKNAVFPDRPKWDHARVERFGEKPLKPQLLKKMMAGIDEPFKNWWYATLLFLTLALTTPLVAEGEPAIADDGSFVSEPATVRGLPWWAFKMIILTIIPFVLVLITILRIPDSFPMDEKKIAKEGIEPEVVEMTRKEMGFRLSYDAKNDLVARRRSAIQQEMDTLGMSSRKHHLALEVDASDFKRSSRLSLLVSGKRSEPMPPIDEENGTTGKEIDPRVARKSAGINVILFATTIIIATAEMPGVMADVSFTGPPLSYTVYGPGGGCINANIKSTGITTAAIVMDDSSICETDVLNSPDGPSEAYTRLVVSNCESDTFKVALYDCKDSACAKCDTVPESVGQRNVKQLRRNYYDVDFCRQFDGNNEFDSESESTITYGNETNVSFQRFDPRNTDLSSVQKYYRALLTATCGAAWFANNIIDDGEPAGGSSSEHSGMADAQADNSTALPVADPTTEPPSSATTISVFTGHWAVLLPVSLLACMIVQLYM